jgi:hypothetical protein
VKLEGNVVTAARWLFAAMVLSAAILAAGLFATVHAERLWPGLFKAGSCAPSEPPPKLPDRHEPSF